jgi:hypothetical protein
VPPFINKKERKSTQQQQIRFRLHKHTLSRFFFFFFFSLTFRTKYLFVLLQKHSQNHREEEIQEATKKSIIMNRKKAPGTSFSPTETHKYSTEIHLSVSVSLPAAARTQERKKKRDPQQGGKKRKKSPDDEQTLLFLFFFFFFFFTLTLLSHKTDGHKRVVTR